jgi:hypothetical protein
MKMGLAMAACAIALVSEAATAQVIAARIDGAPLYLSTVAAMRDEMAPEQGLDELIAQRVLARWVRARFTAAERAPASTVGFARDVAIDDKLAAMLRRAVPGAPAAVKLYAPDAATLASIFGNPGQLRLDFTLRDDQAALASRTPLLRFGGGTLSVLDVLRRQNVQGRMAFFSHDLGFMQQQARERADALGVLERAAQRYGALPLADLRQALTDQDEVRTAMVLYGLVDGAEVTSALQAALARHVSQAHIDAYYKTHKQLFARVERVRARHIRLDSEAQARAIAAMDGDFAALARRHSVALDARRGGDLGWITAGPDPHWLAALALMQPAGKISAPFRAPVAPGQPASWEILLVEQRIQGFHPSGSETVRYLARKAIAHDKARAELAAARAQALRSADIVVLR